MIKRIVLIILSISLFSPLLVSAKTVSEFEAEVNKYTAELQEKQSRIAKNEAEIAQVKRNIANIEGQIQDTENEIARLQEEIEKSNQEIIKKNEESKKIMQYYQIENGDNAYLEYAFGAESITDMIYRVSIIEQLTEYNDKIMKELKRLIEENKTKKTELAKKNEELAGLKENLIKEKERIEIDTQEIKESLPSVEQRIKEAKANVTYYKNLGCGLTEDIYACQFRKSSGSIPSVGTFQRPITGGNYSRGWTGNYGHRGIDMTGDNENEPVYPIAEGQVAAIYQDSCSSSWCNNSVARGAHCNGNANIIVVRHNYNGEFIYSMYVHLSKYGNYGVGQFVGKDSVIGYVGTTGCSTADHLHLEVTSCHWKAKGGCTYATFQNSSINPTKLGIKFPSGWDNR